MDAAPEVKGSANALDDLLGMGGGDASTAVTESEYDPNYSFTPVPVRKLIQPQQPGAQNQNTGLTVDGAFLRSGSNSYHLLLELTNQGNSMSNFQFKVNSNALGIEVAGEGFPSTFSLAGGASEQVRIQCRINSAASNGQQISGNVLTVQAGLKTSNDLWYFSFPVLLHVCLQ